MLARPAPLPSGSGWSFELMWDGFRAIVSTKNSFQKEVRIAWP
jgi:ATP-dependent DNA ligase